MAYRNTPYFVNFTGGLSGFNNPGGRVYWVATQIHADGISPSDSNSGTSPQQPFSTIQKGLDSCTTGRGDIVAVLPGTYTMTAALTMTKDNVTLCSAHPVAPWTRSPVIITAAATYNSNLLQVDANYCKVIGLGFDAGFTTVTAGLAAIALNSTNTTTDIRGTVLENCFLDLGRAAGAASAADSDMDGIDIGYDANDAAIGTVVRGCTVLAYDSDAITVNVGSANCIIDGCNIDDTGATAGDNGVVILATGCTVCNCFIKTGNSADTDACIAVNIAAAVARLHNNRLAAWGTDTCGVTVVNTATVFSSGNFIGATGAGNVFDYKTASTTPSHAADFIALYAANPEGATGTGITIAGS